MRNLHTYFISIVFFLLYIGSTSLAQGENIKWYGSPYYVGCQYSYCGQLGDTIEEGLDLWWEGYKQYWGVEPYGTKSCYYDTIYYQDGHVTGKYVYVILQGDCSGGGYLYGTLYLIPDVCEDEWNALVTQCGESVYISNWDNTTCTGDCDACPDDPDKTEPGICGCGLPDIDSDGDGTLDCNDGCPGDPDKTEPGICGCGLPDIDSDGDGTLDCNDGCPGDPDKTEPGICGCGLSDIDSDGDGTPDCNDGCPGDPDKIYQGYCGCGTPETDTDGDGTPDCIDECPEDPNKIYQGYCGCGTPDIDTDGDGTPDCIDGCPDDPTTIDPAECISKEENYGPPPCPVQ
jgi:hypothetical protein